MEILVVNEHDKNDIEIDDRYVFILMNKIMGKMTLDGDTEIKKTFVRRDEETDNWIIETDGLNLDFIFTLDYFKHIKCVTNHVGCMCTSILESKRREMCCFKKSRM